MSDIETLLTDEDFKSGFESEVVPAGKYVVKCIKGDPRIRVSEAGNRYLSVRLAAVETQDGERVNSKIIYHTLPFEGTNKDGEPNRRMFAGFISALGLDKDQVREIYTNLVEFAPKAADIGEKETVELKLGGERFALDGRTLMASLKTRTYTNKAGEEVTENRVGSVWAKTE